MVISSFWSIVLCTVVLHSFQVIFVSVALFLAFRGESIKMFSFQHCDSGVTACTVPIYHMKKQ